MVIDDDGSARLVSVDEARRVHAEMYEVWRTELSKLGLEPSDVFEKSGRFIGAASEARRLWRLRDEPIPRALLGGVKHPDVSPQEPLQICRTHFDMGFPEDDRDEDEVEAREAITRETFRGTVWAENQTKNRALRTIVVDELALPDDQHADALAAIGWSFAAPSGIVRPVVIELPDHIKGRQAAIATRLDDAALDVQLVASLDAAAAPGARRNR